MQFNTSTISILLIILFGLVTFTYKFYIKKKSNPTIDNIELVLATIQPIILDVLNDVLKFDFVAKNEEGFKKYWINYVMYKLKNANELTKEEKKFITVNNVKFIAEPILEQIWNMGKE